MTATIYRLPVRRREPSAGPPLHEHPKVRKALGLLCLLSLDLAQDFIEMVQQFERRGGRWRE